VIRTDPHSGSTPFDPSASDTRMIPSTGIDEMNWDELNFATAGSNS
jgi:hypothetical protein